MRMARWSPAVLLLVGTVVRAGAVLAGDAPIPTPEAAADAVVAAVAARDAPALAALAARGDPDPWLVADALVQRDRHDEAGRFAGASPRPDTEGLPAYVASRRGRVDEPARRARLGHANEALAAAAFDAVLEALGPAEATLEDVVAVRLEMGRGLALSGLGRREEASASFTRAATAAERLGWLQRASLAWHRAGDEAYHAARFREARAAWEHVVSLCERRGDTVGAAIMRGNVGLVLAAMGEFHLALTTLERALPTVEAAGHAAAAANLMINLGNAHLGLGNLTRSLEFQERALATKEALGDRRGAAAALSNVGNVQLELGDYAKAMATYRRAHAALEAVGDATKAAATLGNLGAVYRALGEYAKALAVAEQVLAANTALGDRAGAALTMGNLSVIQLGIGAYDNALETSERALAAFEAMGDRAGAAWMRCQIGLARIELGDDVAALASLEQALRMHEALGEKGGAATALGLIGSVHHHRGEHRAALAKFERALAAKEALGDRAGAAATLCNVGVAHHALGDSVAAIRHLERAVRAAEKLRATVVLASSLRELARVRLATGDVGRAMADAHRGVLELRTLVGGLGDEQGATARGQFTALFATGLAAAARLDDVAEAAFFLESGRAGTLLESLGGRDAMRWQALPDELRRAEAEARSRETRALAAYRAVVDGGDLAALRVRDRELAEARAVVQQVVERIERDAKRAASLWYPVASPIEDLQASLAPGDALVLYGLGDDGEPARALVLARDAARIVSLGPVRDLVAACDAFDPSDPQTDPAPALARLREVLVAPLGLQASTKRLMVSPEGPLGRIPFAALAPDLVVSYQASGTTLGVLLEERGRRGERVLALGDPDYGARYDATAFDVHAPPTVATAGKTRGSRLVPLPGTRAEAKAVGDVVLLGRDASEAGLRAALAARGGRWRAVHFACHGLVHRERPMLSALALTPDEENDGFLTVLDVLRLELPADLVVLSACETGSGRVAAGEGIVGLTRAFMFAGAPRVVCSLWKVDDEATRALMTKFYELWHPPSGAASLGPAAALRQAQAFVRAQAPWRHPYYWAAWVLWGLPD